MSRAAEELGRLLRGAAEALADLRAERERARNAELKAQSALVGGQERLASLRIAAIRAQRERHLQPNEVFGRRAKSADGSSNVSPVDDATLRSLRLMGLAR